MASKRTLRNPPETPHKTDPPEASYRACWEGVWGRFWGQIWTLAAVLKENEKSESKDGKR